MKKDMSFSINLGGESLIGAASNLSHSISDILPVSNNNTPSQGESTPLFLDPAELHDTKNMSKAQQKKLACQNYIKRFSATAVGEMNKYNIPASITLAQGLLESNSGQSRLARENNNHFGMKCFSKKCGKGHCSNFNDDHHKDFFRKYGSAWESYRAHSQLLSGKRYRHLKNLDPNNYKGWAHGLQKAGYATDQRYAQKLINLIESLELQRFDN